MMFVKEFSRIVCVSLFSYQGFLSRDSFIRLPHLSTSVNNFFQVFLMFFSISDEVSCGFCRLLWRPDYFTMYSVICQQVFLFFWNYFKFSFFQKQFVFDSSVRISQADISVNHFFIKKTFQCTNRLKGFKKGFLSFYNQIFPRREFKDFTCFP